MRSLALVPTTAPLRLPRAPKNPLIHPTTALITRPPPTNQRTITPPRESKKDFDGCSLDSSPHGHRHSEHALASLSEGANSFLSNPFYPTVGANAEVFAKGELVLPAVVARDWLKVEDLGPSRSIMLLPLAARERIVRTVLDDIGLGVYAIDSDGVNIEVKGILKEARVVNIEEMGS
ncbi:hypothetical protein Dimus_006173 [Dionaea muscipula]